MSASQLPTGSGSAARRILVTGAAGYVAGLLIPALARRPEIERVVGLDLRPRPAALADVPNLEWIEADLSLDGWQDQVCASGVDAVIHLAFQIKQLYGARRSLQERWNLAGSRNLFGFALSEPGIRRLIHFSTVTAYGAEPGNRLDRLFTESDPLLETDYLYGVHKARIENILREVHAASDKATDVVILRPASITGPFGREAKRFGLVSTLAGVLPIIPVGRLDWCRQYLHEEEVVEIVAMVLFGPERRGFEVFNVSPSDLVVAQDFARIFGEAGPIRKKVMRVPPIVIRAMFSALWHLSRGRVMTPPGSWKFLTYPVAVDGTKLTRVYGRAYRYTSRETLTGKGPPGLIDAHPLATPSG